MKGLLKAGIGFVDTVIWFRSFLVSLQVFQPKNLENGVLSISRRLKYARRKWNHSYGYVSHFLFFLVAKFDIIDIKKMS